MEKIYNESKRKLNEAEEKNRKLLDLPKEKQKGNYYERVENMYHYVESLRNNHADLCSFIGKEEEALNLYCLSESKKSYIFDEKFSSFVEKMDKEKLKRIYEDILRESIYFTQPPDYLNGARAAEKLGLIEAKEYYEKALIQREEALWFNSAFRIAKKLNIPEKMNLYTEIVNYLYINKFI